MHIMERAYYAATIEHFLEMRPEEILGILTRRSMFPAQEEQKIAWREEITILRRVLTSYRGRGKVYFEYTVPRLGKRIDVVALVDHVIFVLEFKVGEKEFPVGAEDQVWDYALDLKNFHETSHDKPIVPVLVATGASGFPVRALIRQDDNLYRPVCATADGLGPILAQALALSVGPGIDAHAWEQGRYCPTPTIIEAAMALYRGHSVRDISRNDASAVNLGRTSEAIAEVINWSRTHHHKSICFVTGVPGAGKTLVGLNIATTHIDKASDLYSVFLSGNGPLVTILREALARDKVAREKESGTRLAKSTVMSEVKLFIQNVHNFRDECLVDAGRPPIEHVALFDEAQRAWNLEQTASFMRRKKRRPDFNHSEPEYLISCLDRHPDWATIVCFVGGGQEINTGEAGIGEWIQSLRCSFPDWHIHISTRLGDEEYGAGSVLKMLKGHQKVDFRDELHLGVSMRSFRAEHVSMLVKQLLDRDELGARRTLETLEGRYPIVITRDLGRAKEWLRKKARGSERYGLVVSSNAQRLKPHAIDVKSPVNPIHWFLSGKDDVRSSYYLEDVVTEFQIQGLELDWACVTWDADFRCTDSDWEHFSFVGDRWRNIRKPERRAYLKNAYRVLLTRARQGMVIVVPEGDETDPTRSAGFYDPTFAYLKRVGFSQV